MRKLDLAFLEKAWNDFLKNKKLLPGIDLFITNSWKRCVKNLNPWEAPRWVFDEIRVMQRSAVQRGALWLVARPIMEDVYQFIEGSETLLVLTDNDACISEMIGDPGMREYAEALGFRQGGFLDEVSVGTNAFSVALIESFPVQVIGPEHFLNKFHSLYSAAAPIHDSAGHSIGTIGLIQKVEQDYAKSLGITFAMAKAIENEMEAEHFIREANDQATEFLATLNAVYEGVLAWNSKRIITHLNDRGGKLLGLEPSIVVGRPLTDYILFPESVARAVARGEELRDIEAGLSVNALIREVLLSVCVIRQTSGEPTAYIATLRPIAQVHQLVTRLVGAQARLILDDVIGQSMVMRHLRSQSMTTLNSSGNVLLWGERGTGKNLLARAIHNSGNRAAGPFLTINCRSIPRELVMGEFLGFEPGALNSSADSGQPSKFELADAGTLFLDEVDTLPLEIQSALVRILESGEIIRLGGARVIPINVRIIASTTTNLEKKIKDGFFRQDLYDSFAAFVIKVPALREHTEDIPLLIERSLNRLRLQMGRSLSITSEAKRILCDYPWPGNIAELESVIERVAVNCAGNVIETECLAESVRKIHVKMKAITTEDQIKTLEEAERQTISAAIRISCGNLSKAAKILSISRNTLYRKLKKHDLRIDVISDN